MLCDVEEPPQQVSLIGSEALSRQLFARNSQLFPDNWDWIPRDEPPVAAPALPRRVVSPTARGVIWATLIGDILHKKRMDWP